MDFLISGRTICPGALKLGVEWIRNKLHFSGFAPISAIDNIHKATSILQEQFSESKMARKRGHFMFGLHYQIQYMPKSQYWGLYRELLCHKCYEPKIGMQKCFSYDCLENLTKNVQKWLLRRLYWSFSCLIRDLYWCYSNNTADGQACKYSMLPSFMFFG